MKNIKYLFFFLIVILSISFSGGINTSDYYDLIKFNNYQQFPNRGSNDNQHQKKDFYYPDICYNATRNNVNGTVSFHPRYFTESYDYNKNLYISKDSNMIVKTNYIVNDDVLNILCIEGSLIVEPNDDFPLVVGAIIILPGGIFSSQRSIVIKDLYEPNSLIDPLGYFPGILSLGGSLTLSSPNKLLYPATRLSASLLLVPGLVNIENGAFIFSESYPLGVKAYTFSSSVDQLGIGIEIPETDKNINLFYFKKQSITTSEFSTTGSSIYITAGSNVLIENYYISLNGKTTNEQYDDTVLVFDPNDSNIVTDIIIGTNQRFRPSLFIENSNNVVIKGSVISETIETRAPIIISESKIIIQNSLVASKSGSNIISQYGTELIQSSNNIYYLSKAENGISQIQSSVSSSYMDYGFEGNGIYSLSPNIQSTSDTFIGSYSNIFNFNFIENRSSVTGYNYDCFAPCTLSSVLVSSLSQFPVDFKIKTPSLSPVPSRSSSSSSYSSNSNEPVQNEELLLNIKNGNQQTRYFTINGLSISSPIKLNLNNSVLTLSKIANDGFNIQGTIGKLNIINSTIGSNLKLTSNSTVISNSYIRGEFNSNTLFKGTSYHYDIDNLNIELPIVSTFPIDPYQITVNSTVNIMIQLGSSTFKDVGIKCQFISINSNEVNSSIPIGPDNKCNLPLSVTNEGTTNLKVIISSDTIPSINYYTLIFPPIYSFNNYSLTNGWKFVPPTPTPSATPTTSNSNLKSYIHLVSSTQIDNQFNKECTKTNGCEIISNQIKIESNLPSSSSEYLPTGISTSNSFEPLNINLAVSELKNNEIQLYFTSFNPIDLNPVDSNPSPLSIYLNNQPISILDTSNQQNFKKVIYFENTGQLSTVQLSIISRGDIYLTGAAIYSTFIPSIIIPTIIPNKPDIPPFSDNFNSKVLYIIVFVGVGLFILSVIGVALAFKKHRINLKNQFKLTEIAINKRVAHELEMEEIRKKQLYIEENMTNTGVSFYTNSIVDETEITTDSTYTTAATDTLSNNTIALNKIINHNNLSEYSSSTTNHNPSGSSHTSIIMNNEEEREAKHNYYKKKYRQYKEKNNDNYYYSCNNINNNNNNKNVYYDENNEMAVKLGVESIIKENFKKYMSGLRRLYGTFPLIENSLVQNIVPISPMGLQGVNKSPDRYNTSSVILQKTQESLWYKWDSEELPITISKRTLHFGHQGRKVQSDRVFYDQIQITNNSSRSLKITLHLPNDNGAGFVTTATPFLLIDTLQTVTINFAIILHCTTKWYEKLAVQIQGYGHTFLLMHLETVFTTKLDYRELEFEEYVGQMVLFIDLKPENVLIVDLNPDAVVCVRIADFGTCKEIGEIFNPSANNNLYLTEAVGTPIYQSNEVLNKESYNNSTDVYSFGMSLYELMVEELPFSDYKDLWEVPSLIISGVRPTRGMDSFDIDIKSLIIKCWDPVASQRPTFDQIVIDLRDKSEKLIEYK